jgi:hypothetical protein
MSKSDWGVPIRDSEIAGVVWFDLAILLVGAARFVLTVWGASDEIAKYASMTAVIFAGTLWLAVKARTYRQLLVAAFLLILPYMAVELIGIGYTWTTGRATIFHAPQYSFGSPIHLHFWGHLIGGLTWEPLALFLLMAVIHALFRLLTQKRVKG